MPGEEKAELFVVEVLYLDMNYSVFSDPGIESDALLFIGKIQAILVNRDEQLLRAMIAKGATTENDEVLVELCEEILENLNMNISTKMTKIKT